MMLLLLLRLTFPITTPTNVLVDKILKYRVILDKLPNEATIQADPQIPINRLQSYLAMCEFTANDIQISKQIAKERAKSVISDFGNINFEWTTKLEINSKTLQIKSTIDNVWLILENGHNLRGKFALNEFARHGEVLSTLPWNPSPKRCGWSDNDNQGLYWYFEKTYRVTSNGKIDSALSLHSEQQTGHISEQLHVKHLQLLLLMQ